MNLLDLIIIASMILLLVRGIFRGFFREIGSIAGVILGIWLAASYQPAMTRYLRHSLPNADVSILQLISFAVVFTLVLLLCNLGGWAVSLVLRRVFLGWADRSLGAGLALVKGVIITYLAIVLLTFLVPSKTPLVAESRLAPLVIRSYQSMAGLVSPSTYKRWKGKLLEEEGGDDAAFSGTSAIRPGKAKRIDSRGSGKQWRNTRAASYQRRF